MPHSAQRQGSAVTSGPAFSCMFWMMEANRRVVRPPEWVTGRSLTIDIGCQGLVLRVDPLPDERAR
jgi:hypothetical protein